MCAHAHASASALSYLVMSNFCGLMECSPDRILCPWNFPGKNSGASCHFLFQVIFLTQESNSGLLRIVGTQILPSEKYRFTYIYFMLWVIMNTTLLTFCSNCPSLDTEFFFGSGVSLLCPHYFVLLFWAPAYSLAPYKFPGKLCAIPATVLEWVIYSRIFCYDYWRRVLENKFICQ